MYLEIEKYVRSYLNRMESIDYLLKITDIVRVYPQLLSRFVMQDGQYFAQFYPLLVSQDGHITVD